jgi:hypothetical protein
MPRPLKISEKGARLTCAEHDANIDRLLARENHTGVQSASTIYDLKTTILGFPELQALFAQDETFQTQLNSLRDEVLLPTGHVQQALDALEARLSAAIATDLARIVALEQRVAIEMARTDANALAISTQTTRISTAISDIALNDADNEALWGAIGGRNANRLFLPLPHWAGQVPGNSNILFLQYDTYLNVVYWNIPQVIVGGWVGSYQFTEGQAGIIDFGELQLH